MLRFSYEYYVCFFLFLSAKIKYLKAYDSKVFYQHKLFFFYRLCSVVMIMRNGRVGLGLLIT